MQNWRYLTVLFRRHKGDRTSPQWHSAESNTVLEKGATLDEYGLKGWELIAILPEKWTGEGGAQEVIVTAFFKQPIPKEERK